MTIKNFHSILNRQVLRIVKGINKPQWKIYLLEGIENKNVDDLLDLAYAYIGRENVQKALDYMLKAVEENPNDFYANVSIGNIYHNLGYADKALLYLNKICEEYKRRGSDHRFSDHLAYIGNCHRNLGNFPLAKEFYQASLEILPYNLYAINGLVEMFKDTGKFDLILPLLKNTLEKFPDLYPLNALLASHYHYYLYDYDNALIEYEKVEKNKIQRKKILAKYGYYTYITYLERSSFNNYTIALVQSGKKEKALKIINNSKILGIFWGVECAIRALYYYEETEEWKVGYKIFENIGNYHKDDFYPFYEILCEYEARLGKIDSALRRAEKYYKMFPLDGQICITYAGLLKEKKDYEKAVFVYSDVIRRYPYQDDWREGYARCLLLSGDIILSLIHI